MALNKKSLVCISFMIILMTGMRFQNAYAVPSFTRKFNLACSTCHSAWPKLNSFGRQFKLNGYHVAPGDAPDAVEPSDNLSIEKNIQASIAVHLRPFVKQTGPISAMPVINEAAIFFLATSKKFSLWGEATGGADGNFALAWEHVDVSYHESPAINLMLTNGHVFRTDPFQDLYNMGNLTDQDKSILTDGHASGEALAGMKQSIALYGLLGKAENIYYSLGLGADQMDNNGIGPRDVTARVAYMLPSGLTIGSFLDSGKQAVTLADPTGANVANNLKFSRIGLDLQYETPKFTVFGVYSRARDDIHSVNGGGSEGNNAFYIEGFYPFQFKNNPALTFVPVVRLERFTQNNGNNKFTELTMNLTHYFKENAKGFLEYWTQTNVPSGQVKNKRFALGLDIGF